MASVLGACQQKLSECYWEDSGVDLVGLNFSSCPLNAKIPYFKFSLEERKKPPILSLFQVNVWIKLKNEFQISFLGIG